MHVFLCAAWTRERSPLPGSDFHRRQVLDAFGPQQRAGDCCLLFLSFQCVLQGWVSSFALIWRSASGVRAAIEYCLIQGLHCFFAINCFGEAGLEWPLSVFSFGFCPLLTLRQEFFAFLIFSWQFQCRFMTHQADYSY